MDYRAEQLDEIEAIESIYSEEVDIIGDSPHRFTIPAKTEDYDDEEKEGGMQILMKFTFPNKYPEEKPEIEFEESDNIEDEHLKELRVHLDGVAEENLGMPMVFSIVSEAIQWLGDTNDRLKEEAAEAIRKRKEADDEEERKKLEGTKVTIESFLAWKAEFDAEIEAAKKDLKAKVKKDGKKTGRELFMTDMTLNDSDLKFLAETGDTAITVDESLFEDMEDLDIEDGEDSEDDPDWDGGESDD